MSRTATEALVDRLLDEFGAGGARVFRAPGRVSLIGGHVDYHEGVVLPMAIDRDVLVAARPRADGRVVLRSIDLAGDVNQPADGSVDPRAVVPAWGRLVAAVVRTLARAGRPAVGMDALVGSTLTIGGGLSSSAAFEVAVALALCEAAGWSVDGARIARACQVAEHAATGVPCGIQDQMVALRGVRGHALLLDCRTLHTDAVPLPDSVQVLIVHSGVARTLAGSPYARRRAEAEAVAARLGLRSLRDATAAQVAREPRGRHVVSEIERVLAFAGALRAGDVDRLGPLMLASHTSLRDDMDVSTPELDALVECLVGAGALGARLTGGGFGGCVVALVPAGAAGAVAERAAGGYRARTGREPTAFAVRAAAGAGTVG